MKVLVTGASGFVGTHLCEKLLQAGHVVIALVRTPRNFTLTHANLSVIQGDLDQETLYWTSALPDDLDSCIHTAGIVHSYVEAEFYRVNAQGSANLISNLKNKFSKLHFILISSLAAAGPSLGASIRNEVDIDFPVSIYGRSKKEAEDYLKKNAPDSWTLSIVRPPMVIGPRDSAVLDIFKMVKGGVILLPGSDSKLKRYSFVCVFDLVDTIQKIFEKKKESLYYSSYPKTVTFNELILEIKKQLKKTWIIYLPMPLFIVKILAFILSLLYRIRPHSLRLTPDKYYELKAQNWTCEGHKSEVELGQVYNYNLEKTITVTLNDYKHRKWI